MLHRTHKTDLNYTNRLLGFQWWYRLVIENMLTFDLERAIAALPYGLELTAKYYHF